MERINYGLEDNDGRGDLIQTAILKLEGGILELEKENGELHKRLDALESRFRIHIREEG